MNHYMISEDIYKDYLFLSEESYKISDEIFEESISLNMELLKKEEYNSYKLSGRYWIWRIGKLAYMKLWNSMVDNGEMILEAPGLKYLKSYPTLELLEEAYAKEHPDKKGITVNPAAYYAFANYLRKGDIIIAYNSSEGIVGWGIIEGDYMYRPTRKSESHYRKTSWGRIQMPFIFSNRKSALYMLSKDEILFLFETLASKGQNDKNPLPFEFIKRNVNNEKEIDCRIDSNVERKKKFEDILNFGFEKNKLLGGIISSLMASF